MGCRKNIDEVQEEYFVGCFFLHLYTFFPAPLHFSKRLKLPFIVLGVSKIVVPLAKDIFGIKNLEDK